MDKMTVRLVEITLQNFKNVEYGNLSLDNTRKAFKASILGLYGQNGSGKTALIDALELLKFALSGSQIPEKFADYIHSDSQKAALTVAFRIGTAQGDVPFIYQFSISRVAAAPDPMTGTAKSSAYAVELVDELIRCSIPSGNKEKIGRLIDTRVDEDILFTPIPKLALLTGSDRKTRLELLVAKRLAAQNASSFVFSKQLLSVIGKRAAVHQDNQELLRYWQLLSAVAEFGRERLFIINTANSGLISLNAQPLSFQYEENNQRYVGSLLLPLDRPFDLPDQAVRLVEKLISKMNIVLVQLIPGLTIKAKALSPIVLDGGGTGTRLQLVSLRNGKELPFKNESEGIKKIVSVLQLLIVVYNQKSMTVAIDELDSGIFEYLLGEILRILSEKGKGQLIFTSHNLRPLETIDRGFAAFTTTNPKNRYVRLTNVKENNNLRDVYYRDLMLGGHDDALYETTRNAAIAIAFCKADTLCGDIPT
ncbi:MAG: AAA family ATPase [Duodenibacillus sp.]|nr:AAA family ATPase [Duodenibacillus sp.]